MKVAEQAVFAPHPPFFKLRVIFTFFRTKISLVRTLVHDQMIVSARKFIPSRVMIPLPAVPERPEGGVEETAGPEQPDELAHNGGKIGYVLEDRVRADNVEPSV